MTEEILFHEALAKPPAERGGFLAAACAGQPELRAAVEALLAAHEASGNLLDRPPAEVAQTMGSQQNFASGNAPTPPPVVTVDQTPPIAPTTVIAGRYKLIEEIGEGGMGTVFMAQQTEPVKRLVAVKIIKPGMDSREVLARFEAERQALALMDHPNISRVLDAGSTESGRPFFVMELVKGTPITQYCDQHRLTPRQRMELFLPVCQAIQHAHQKGVIHRDIKPSNVLVALYDDHPVPKVIDFGLAKAIGQALTEKTLITGFGALVGTPEYMSPEQANLNNLDIDTRCDIYTLGVLLYELLTGSTPVDRKSLANAALLEVLRIVRDVEAPRPSTKLSSSANLVSIAANRGTEPGKLTKLLQGELDWVLLKALEKDRGRRYETANGLARDIQRYLADEIVEARPPSTSYRLRKFVRRHKAQVIAAGLLFLTLLAGIAGTTFGLVRAEHQRLVAEDAQRKEHDRADGEQRAKLEAEARRVEAEKQQRRAEAGEKLADERLKQVEEQKGKVEAEKKKAQDENRIAQAVQSFLQDKLLGQVDVRKQADDLLYAGRRSAEANRNLTLRELLDRAAVQLAPEKIEACLPKESGLQASVLGMVGKTYLGIGEYDRAIGLLQRSMALSSRELGPQHPVTLDAMSNLAGAYEAAGNMDLALPLYEKTLKLMTESLGPDHPDTAATMNNLAAAYYRSGKPELALPLCEESLMYFKKAFPPHDRQILTSMENLAAAYEGVGKVDLALPLFQEALNLMRARLGPEHPNTLLCMGNLAGAYQAAGKLDVALPLFETTFKLIKAKLGPDHPDTLTIMNDLAAAYEAAGKAALAVPIYEEAFALEKAKLGSENPLTLHTMNSLAGAYQAVGKLELAVPLFEKSLKLDRAKLGPEHPETLSAMCGLAVAYQVAGKLDLALPLFEKEARLLKAKLGPAHPYTLSGMNRLAAAYLVARKLDLALPLLEETLKLQKANVGCDHPETLRSMCDLASAYEAAGKLDLALPLYQETVKLQTAKLGRDHPETLRSMGELASAYEAAGKLDLALPLYEETVKLQKAKLGPEHHDTITNMNRLGVAYWKTGKLDRSIPIFEDALRLQEAKLGRRHVKTLLMAMNLGVNYKAAGRVAEALPLLEEVYRASKETPALRVAEAPLLDCYIRAGKSEKVVSLAKELVAGARIQFPKNSPSLAEELMIISRWLVQVNAFAEAEPLYREALAVREKSEPDAWTTFNSKSMLGGALLGQKKYAEAEPLLLAGYQGLKEREATMSPRDKVRVTEAMERLVQLYDALGRKDEAAKWHKELQSLQDATTHGQTGTPRAEDSRTIIKVATGPRHPDTLSGLSDLPKGRQDADKLGLALPSLEKTLKQSKAKLGPDHPDTLTSMSNLANAYQTAGKLDLALPLFEETLKLRKANLGTKHPDTLTSMSSLAMAYQAAGKLDLALPLFEEALKLMKATLGPEHRNTLTGMNSLALAYQAAGMLERGLPLFEETRKLTKEKFGPEDSDTLRSINNLAMAYRDAGKLDLALPLLEGTLKLTKEKLGPEHLDTLTTMNYLAMTYHSAGKLYQALPLYKEVFTLRKAKLGPEHPETLASMSNLTAAYLTIGRLDLALPLSKDALKLTRAKLGPEDPATLNSMTNLAAAYQAARKFDLALPLLEETVKLSKAKLGPEHPDTLQRMNNLAITYDGAGKLDLALPLFEETFRLREKKLGKKHPDTLWTAANLGAAYKDAGRITDALPLLEEAYRASKKISRLQWVSGLLFDAYVRTGEREKAAALTKELLAVARRKLPNDSPQLASVLGSAGFSLTQVKAFTDAEPLLRESLAICETLQRDHISTYLTKSLLGAALLGQKKYAEAEPLLLAGYRGMKEHEASIPPGGVVRLTDTLEHVVQLYDAWGKKEEAAKWRKELQSFKNGARGQTDTPRADKHDNPAGK
jgi:eukaryotic-like serine/threonine-protein kinase